MGFRDGVRSWEFGNKLRWEKHHLFVYDFKSLKDIEIDFKRNWHIICYISLLFCILSYSKMSG